MTPEEKERVIAETQKLKAEAESLKKGWWGRPSSWIPMLAAIAAIATSIGQFQLSSISQREAAVTARENVLEAKEEEKLLREKNEELEQKARALTEQISKATNESLQLEEEIKKANDQLLAFARKEGENKSLAEAVEKEVSQRAEKTESIVASAKRRNAQAQIESLVWQMNSNVKQVRLDTVEELIGSHRSNEAAISGAIDLITMPRLESLSASGRINALVFLRNTDPAVWNAGLKERAQTALRDIRERAEQGKVYIGPQTEEAMQRLETMLVDLP